MHAGWPTEPWLFNTSCSSTTNCKVDYLASCTFYCSFKCWWYCFDKLWTCIMCFYNLLPFKQPCQMSNDSCGCSICTMSNFGCPIGSCLGFSLYSFHCFSIYYYLRWKYWCRMTLLKTGKKIIWLVNINLHTYIIRKSRRVMGHTENDMPSILKEWKSLFIYFLPQCLLPCIWARNGLRNCGIQNNPNCIVGHESTQL